MAPDVALPYNGDPPERWLVQPPRSPATERRLTALRQLAQRASGAPARLHFALQDLEHDHGGRDEDAPPLVRRDSHAAAPSQIRATTDQSPRWTARLRLRVREVENASVAPGASPDGVHHLGRV